MSKSYTLSPKINALTITATDSAGNSASKILRVYLAQNAEAGPSVVITSPSRDTLVNRNPVSVTYTLDGIPLAKSFTLTEGQNRLIVDTTLFPGFSGADTVNVTLDTHPPLLVVTSPAQDTVVQSASLTVQYTVDGAAKSKAVTLVNGFNTITLRELDAAGNEGTVVRKVHYLPGGATPIVADAKVQDTIFTYQVFTLDARDSRGPSGVPLLYAWRQIQGNAVHISAGASQTAGVLSRGPGLMWFELTVADVAGILPSSLDTVAVEVLEPENDLEFAQALEVAKSGQDDAFALTLDIPSETSIYTQESSIRLEGSLTGTTGTLGSIRWTSNARTGNFQPSGSNWTSSVIPLDLGDNWVTLVYTQGSQIAVERILVSRGEVDMAGFDLNPNIFWIDSAMNFKLVVNIDDPAVSTVQLARILDQEVDLGALVDDGTGGDDFAMDRRYTLQFNLTPKADSVYWFRVKANKSGVNSYSAIYAFRPRLKFDSTYAPILFSMNAQANSLLDTLRADFGRQAAFDSVVSWLRSQSSVATAGINADSNGVFWKYNFGVRAVLAENTQGTLAIGSEIRTKGIAPYLWEGFDQDSILFQSDMGEEVYRKMLDSLRQIDSSLWKIEPIIANDSAGQQIVKVSDFKNWNGYKTILMETHGGLLGYGKLPAVKPQFARWDSGSHVGLSTDIDITKDSLQKYWSDMTGEMPRMLASAKRGAASFILTESFFDHYTNDTKGTLISIAACQLLSNDNLWKTFRRHGDDSTAMTGFSGDVFIPFARKSMGILYKNLIDGKTLSESYEAVKSYCASDEAKVPGTSGGRICEVRNQKPCDQRRPQPGCMEIRGNRNFTLKPRLGRAWHWGVGSRYSCATAAPDTVAKIKNIKSVSGGFGHGLALEANGTVWGWGWNGAGQLGSSPTRTSGGELTVPNINYRSCNPLQVFPGSGYKAISAGASRSLAVDASGQVWRAGEFLGGSSDTRWVGDDGFGNSWMIGVVNVSQQHAMVPGLTNIKSVSAGSRHNLALDANGDVWSWGGNGAGELGFGDTLPRISPAKIPGLVNIVAISGGNTLPPSPQSAHSLALDRNGRVWAWGENSSGELGLHDTLDRSSPQLVPGLVKVKAISAGLNGSSAIDSTGRLWSWGLNDEGQLGLGNSINQSIPVAVPGVTNAVEISHGRYPVLVEGNGNTLWSCGAACGNTFVQRKVGSFSPGSGGDHFGLTVSP